MMTFRRPGRWPPRLLLVSVVLILVVVEVLQYQWFRQSANLELQSTMHGLEAGVRQVILREYQRYAPLLAELEEARTPPPPSETEQSLMTQVWKTYGPQGTAPNLVTWVGWAGDDRRFIQRLDAQGRHRVPRPGRPQDDPGAESPEGSILAWAPPAGALDQATLCVRAGRGLFVGLDSGRFLATYVRPALAEAYPGSSVRWANAPHFPPPPGSWFDTGDSPINPLASLWSGSSVPLDVSVELPRFPGTPRAPSPSGSGEFPRSEELGFIVFTVTLSAETPALGVERRMVWNFLGATLLLGVIGVAFGLVVRQSMRLADLRRREREFVASVSHELRTPLTVIRSAADNLTHGVVPASRQIRYGNLIFDQSLRLGRMIEEMLGFARAEAGPPAANPTVVVLLPWIEAVRPSLDAIAATQGVTLDWNTETLPESGVFDPEALRLVLENLVVNAVNHAYSQTSAPGPRDVRIRLRLRTPERLELTVEDDGRGIAAQEANMVFEPFYRDQVSRNSQEPGSGLGLFLAAREARRLGGRLRLESPWKSPEGVRRPGCRFTLTLPLLPTASGSHRV